MEKRLEMSPTNFLMLAETARETIPLHTDTCTHKWAKGKGEESARLIHPEDSEFFF